MHSSVVPVGFNLRRSPVAPLLPAVVQASPLRDATTPVQFGMDNILPDNYPAIPGIKAKNWTGLAYGAGPPNRWEFRWADVEQTHNAFTYTKYDPIVDAAQASGMGLVAILNTTPYWASSTITATGTQMPANLYLAWDDPNNYWGNFVYHVASTLPGTAWPRGRSGTKPDQINNLSWGGTEGIIISCSKWPTRRSRRLMRCVGQLCRA